MIMPIDIDKKEFSRDKRGYNSREVDEFLDLIVVDYEKVLNDNRSMAHKIKSLEKELEDAQQSDTAMVETLQTAKKLMADISASAERRAELMMRDAELEAENIMTDAKTTVKKLTDEHQVLAAKVERLRKNFKRMLEAELEDLENDGYSLLADMDISDIVDHKEPEPAPAKTIVFNEGIKEEIHEEAQEEINEEIHEEISNEDSAIENLVQEIKEEPISEPEQATLSDLSEGFQNMTDEDASMDSTIILK